MRYIKTYKIFENKVHFQTDLNKYYIKKKYWDYELGYIWSPNHRIRSVYRDPSVVGLKEERDGMTLSLISTSLGFLFKEYTGASSLKELCLFHPNSQTDSELMFLLENPLEERYYALVENPSDNKNIVVKQLETFGKLDNYRDVIREVLGKDYTDEEIDNDDCSSWHVAIKLYEHNGVRYLGYNLTGTIGIICLRSDLEKILDMTETCNYYRYEDKSSQEIRIRGKQILFYETDEIFYELKDYGMDLIDMSLTGKHQLMLRFYKPDVNITDELIDEIKETVMRFNQVNDCALSMIKVTRNGTLFMREHDQDVIGRGRPVYDIPTANIEEIEKLKELNMNAALDAYNIRQRPHAIYFLFDI